MDSVGCSFDAVTVRAVSLDHPVTCSLSPWAEALCADLVEAFVECVGESVRGKARLVGNLAADRTGSCV